MHIRGELTRLGIAYKENSNSFQIVCPHPHPGGGANTHKNYGIKKDGKTSFCFVCRATGSWQKVAPVLGAQKFGGTGLVSEDGLDTNVAALVRQRLARMALDDDDSTEIPDNMKPWVGSWRGLTEPFLRAMHAQHWWQVITKDDRMFTTERIWFPCMQVGEYVGYVSRRLDSSDIARYYNAPWMKSTEVLFGFDYARSLGGKSIVLVEGPVDAMRLLHGGVPAVAILGTNNFGEKQALLAASGYTKAYILFDNDEAGREAVPMAISKIRKVMDYEVMSLPQGKKDPGELEEAEVSWLRHYTQSR